MSSLNTSLDHIEKRYSKFERDFNDVISNSFKVRDYIIDLLENDEELDLAGKIKLISSLADLHKCCTASLKESILLDEKFFKMTSTIDHIGSEPDEEFVDVENLIG